MKRCPACGQTLSIEVFNRNKRRADGRAAYCRDCAVEKDRQYRAADPERYQQYATVGRAARRETLLAGKRRYYQAHRAAHSAKTRAWAAAHPTARRAVRRAWNARHRLYCRESYRRYMALKTAATVEKVDYQAIWERDGGVCYLCQQPVTDRADLHFDHVIPLSKGGPHSADNIRVTHALCNLSKGAKILPLPRIDPTSRG